MVEYYAIIKDKKAKSGESLAYLAHLSSYMGHSHRVMNRSRCLSSNGLVKKLIICKDGITPQGFLDIRKLVECRQLSPDEVKRELESDRYKEFGDPSGFSFSILF